MAPVQPAAAIEAEPEIEAAWSFADLIATPAAVEPSAPRTDPASRAFEEFPLRRSSVAAKRAGRAKPVPASKKAAARKASATTTPGGRVPRSGVVSIKAFGPTTKKKVRKNPISVMTTMIAVAGMFAVAGLPAYATTLDQNAKADDAKLATDTQSIVVDASVAPLTALRDGYNATTPEQLAQMSRDDARAALNEAYNASGARALGDDYPWPYELADVEGGGLSPLNYYYRECVDFVAWRLNRDAGSYAAPFKWVWSNLTPSGGNASQWLYAWQNHGWQTSNTPIAGSVAWFNGNHVAYVTRVNADGTVFIEEYNHGGTHVYGQRTIPASDVAMFLYPPPS
ncbi:MAG: CHAP domain-containing protein [Rhodoglobus sp.]